MIKHGKTWMGALAAFLLGSAAQAAVVLDTSDTNDLEVGDTFIVTVATDDAQAAFDSFQFDLTFDAGIIGYLGGTFGPAFTFTNAQQEPPGATGGTTVSNITGGVIFQELSGALTLVDLEFVVRAAGTTDVALSPAVGFFLTLLGSAVEAGTPPSFTLSIAEAPGDAVPLPAGALLFAPALAFLVRKARAQA
ncbi:cohesin domain-containing protein [Parvularcula maris]|nr:cohesin domain-containing protein [Parvularcula maris]